MDTGRNRYYQPDRNMPPHNLCQPYPVSYLSHHPSGNKYVPNYLSMSNGNPIHNPTMPPDCADSVWWQNNTSMSRSAAYPDQPQRNISPRFTYQENMTRVVVPPNIHRSAVQDYSSQSMPISPDGAYSHGRLRNPQINPVIVQHNSVIYSERPDGMEIASKEAGYANQQSKYYQQTHHNMSLGYDYNLHQRKKTEIPKTNRYTGPIYPSEYMHHTKMYNTPAGMQTSAHSAKYAEKLSVHVSPYLENISLPSDYGKHGPPYSHEPSVILDTPASRLPPCSVKNKPPRLSPKNESHYQERAPYLMPQTSRSIPYNIANSSGLYCVPSQLHVPVNNNNYAASKYIEPSNNMYNVESEYPKHSVITKHPAAQSVIVSKPPPAPEISPKQKVNHYNPVQSNHFAKHTNQLYMQCPVVPHPYQNQHQLHGSLRQHPVSYNQNRTLPQRQSVVSTNLEHYKNQIHPYHPYYGNALNAGYNGGRYSPNAISPSDSNASDSNSSGVGSNKHSSYLDDGGYGSRCSTASSIGSGLSPDDLQIKYQHQQMRQTHKNAGYYIKPGPEKGISDFENFINTSVLKRTRNLPQGNETQKEGIDVRKFLSTWGDDEEEELSTQTTVINNLPDVVISNNINNCDSAVIPSHNNYNQFAIPTPNYGTDNINGLNNCAQVIKPNTGQCVQVITSNINSCAYASKANSDKNYSQQFLSKTAESSEPTLPAAHINVLPATTTPTSAIPEQLYVLEYVNISSEDVEKYKHITQITELPENVHRIEDIENPPTINRNECKMKLQELELENSNESNLDDAPPKKIQPWSQFYKVEPKIGKLQGDFRLSIELDSIPKNNSSNALKERGERPPTPFDVESILQQSIITKEIPDNFEMQPGATSTQIKIMSNVLEKTPETTLTIVSTEDEYVDIIGPYEEGSKGSNQQSTWNKQIVEPKPVSQEIIKTDKINGTATQSLLKKIRKERNKYKDRYKLKESLINKCKNMKSNLKDVLKTNESSPVDYSINNVTGTIYNNKTDLELNAETQSEKTELLNTRINEEIDINKYETKDPPNLKDCVIDNNSNANKSDKIVSLDSAEYELELDNSTLEENYKSLLSEIENKADSEEVVTLHAGDSESITLHAAPKEKKSIITKNDSNFEKKVITMSEEVSNEINNYCEDDKTTEGNLNNKNENESVTTSLDEDTICLSPVTKIHEENDELKIDDITFVSLNRKTPESCFTDEDTQFYESECFASSIDPLLSPIPKTPGYDNETSSEKMEMNYPSDQQVSTFANVIVNPNESKEDVTEECETQSTTYSEPMDLEVFSDGSNHSIPNNNATDSNSSECMNFSDRLGSSSEPNCFSGVVSVPEISSAESTIASRPNTPGKNLDLDVICHINAKLKNVEEDSIEKLEEFHKNSQQDLSSEENEIDLIKNNVDIQKDHLLITENIAIIGDEIISEDSESCIPILEATDSSALSPVRMLTEYDAAISIEPEEASEAYTLLFINSNDILLTEESLEYDNEYILEASDDNNVTEELGDSFEVTADSEDVVEEIVGFENISDIETNELNNWPYVEEVVIANSPIDISSRSPIRKYISENIASPMMSESENSESDYKSSDEMDKDVPMKTLNDCSKSSDLDDNMNSIVDKTESDSDAILEEDETHKSAYRSCCESLKHVIISKNISQDNTYCVSNKKSESSRKYKITNDKKSDNSKIYRRYSESAISEKSRSEKRHRHLSERNSSWKQKTGNSNSTKQEPIPKVIIRKSEDQHGIVVDHFTHFIDKEETTGRAVTSRKYNGLKIRIPLNICGSALNLNDYKKSFNKLKDKKESQSVSKADQIANKRQPFKVKYKKNFDDVLQDLQYNDLKRKNKINNKPNHGVPKLVIKRYDSNQYISTTKMKSTLSLKGKRCCPSVAIQRNAKIEKLVEIRKATVKVLPNDKLLLTEPQQSLKCTIRIDTNKISLPPALYKIQKSY